MSSDWCCFCHTHLHTGWDVWEQHQTCIHKNITKISEFVHRNHTHTFTHTHVCALSHPHTCTHTDISTQTLQGHHLLKLTVACWFSIGESRGAWEVLVIPNVADNVDTGNLQTNKQIKSQVRYMERKLNLWTCFPIFCIIFFPFFINFNYCHIHAS